MKTYIIIACILTLAACNKQQRRPDAVNPEQTEVRGKSYFQKTAQYPYQGMPPMVAAPVTERDALQQLMADTLLTKLVKNTAAGWEAIDRHYAVLHNGISARKQHLAYVILAHKNLVADARAAEKKKFYITELVNTGYKGYCLLYYALKSLPAAEQGFVNDMVTAISAYGAKDVDAPAALKTDFSTTEDARLRQKQEDVKINYSYIEKFRNWQQETARR